MKTKLLTRGESHMSHVTPEQAMTAYHHATSVRVMEELMQLVDDEAVFLFSNETYYGGSDAIRSAIERNFQLIRNESYSVRDLRWLVRSTDVAVCIYEFEWSGEIGGKAVSGSGRGTNVLRRYETGAWKVIHEHLSRGSLGP